MPNVIICLVDTSIVDIVEGAIVALQSITVLKLAKSIALLVIAQIIV